MSGLFAEYVKIGEPAHMSELILLVRTYVTRVGDSDFADPSGPTHTLTVLKTRFPVNTDEEFVIPGDVAALLIAFSGFCGYQVKDKDAWVLLLTSTQLTMSLRNPSPIADAYASAEAMPETDADLRTKAIAQLGKLYAGRAPRHYTQEEIEADRQRTMAETMKKLTGR